MLVCVAVRNDIVSEEVNCHCAHDPVRWSVCFFSSPYSTGFCFFFDCKKWENRGTFVDFEENFRPQNFAKIRECKQPLDFENFPPFLRYFPLFTHLHTLSPFLHR